MGVLSALLSALLILPVMLWLADWQARQAELRELELLRLQSADRIAHFFESLQASQQQTGEEGVDVCSAAIRQGLRKQAAAELYVEGLGRRLPSGAFCSSVKLPTDSALRHYRHWQFDGVDIWWSSARLTDPDAPSLIFGKGNVRLASSLRYLHALTHMPAHVHSHLLGPGLQVLDLVGSRPELSAAETKLLGRPGKLHQLGGRTYLLGRGDGYGLHLMISRPEQALLAKQRLYRPLWLVLGAVLVLLLGWLVALLLRHDQSLERALQLALQRDEFELDYQPLVDLASGRCTGAEALLRWRRSDGKRVRPDLFIPQAEDSGQITAITRWVIQRVLHEQGELLRTHPELYISVNLAAADILENQFADLATAALQSAGVAPVQLVYEVTERGLVDPERAVAVLAPLREAGHRIAIDDFGTGYSSLSYLQELPVDVLKIDKSFVDALGTEAASSPVAPHIIAMAHALGLKVIAEGVEQPEQARLLAELGAQIGQGWLFAKPLEASAFRAFVAANGSARRQAADQA